MMQTKLKLTAAVRTAVVVVGILLASWFVLEWIRPYLISRYGVEPRYVAGLFVAAEVGFNATLFGIVCILGHRGLAWRELRLSKFKEEIHKNRHDIRVRTLWLLNRAFWIMPFLYIMAVGYSKLPVVVLIGCFVEILLTIWLGLVVMGIMGRKTVNGKDMRKANARSVKIRAATLADIPEIERVDRDVWGEIFPGSRDMFASRIQVFPDCGICLHTVDQQTPIRLI